MGRRAATAEPVRRRFAEGFGQACARRAILAAGLVVGLQGLLFADDRRGPGPEDPEEARVALALAPDDEKPTEMPGNPRAKGAGGAASGDEKDKPTEMPGNPRSGPVATAGEGEERPTEMPGNPKAAPAEERSTVRLSAVIYTDYTYTDTPQSTDGDGNAVNPNAFNVTRTYITITGRLGSRIGFRVNPDVRPDTNDSSSDRSLSGSYVFQLKYAFVQVAMQGILTDGSWVRFGLHQTPYVDYVEGYYRYRFQGSLFTDREGYLASSDAGVSTDVQLPGGFGDVHLGVYNGEGFRKFEANDQKSLQMRLALRPFRDKGSRSGLQLLGFAVRDHYVSSAERSRSVLGALYTHPRVRAGVEHMWATDQNASAATPEVKARGFSAWVTPITTRGVEALSRYDSLRPNTDFGGRKKRLIVGVAYWFDTFKDAQAGLLADFERVTYDSDLPAGLAKPEERRFALHGTISF